MDREYASDWGWLTGIRPAKLMTRLLRDGLDDETAISQMRKLYSVSQRRAEISLQVAKAGLRTKVGSRDIAVYIGVPFCPSRCAYCSFVSSYVGKTSKLMAPFVDTLEYELSLTAQTIDTLGLNTVAVYIGGGTPTSLTLPLFRRMLEITGSFISFDNVKEYTVEAGRPDTITAEHAAAMREHGVNRVSVNPQSMNAATLTAIGRNHSVDDVYKAFELVRDFEAVNMDIIAGLPDENAEHFERTLSSVIALRPENITVHTLSRKKGSDLSHDMTEGSAECVSSMIDYSLSVLPQALYSPYYLYRQKFMAGAFENIGWSLDGHEGLYNVIMMEELASVLALGGGGVTRLVDPYTSFIDRSYNVKYPSEYNNSQTKIANKQQFVIDFYKEFKE